MSSIVPNGQIRFLTQIPIDANYENSLDFLNEVEQRTYFLSQQPVHTMLGATRIRDGVIAVNSLADNLLSANYMMFQNTNFSNKWFYAFITNIEYVNNNMSHVYYQIDDIQTWLFDVQLKQCLVEREHTATDNLFEHLIDEGITTGGYKNSDLATNELSMGSYNAVLFVSFDSDGKDISASKIKPYQGNLNGLTPLIFGVQDNDGNWYPVTKTDEEDYDDMNEMEKLNYFIKTVTEAGRSENLVSLVLIPKELTRDDPYGEYPSDIYLRFLNYTSNTQIDGYTPKNKKLYTSPFCMIEFGTSDGQKEYLQPEYLIAGQNELEIFTNISPSPSILIVPSTYANENYSWNKSISFDAFPQCAMAIDGYKAWVASGGLSHEVLGVINSFEQGLTGGIQGVGTGSGALSPQETLKLGQSAYAGMSGMMSHLINIQYAKRLPNAVKGNINSQPLTANQQIRIYIRQMTINGEQAKSIDDYFTMYGYKVNKLKQPTRRNRPHFTYLKTKGLHVDGGAPADAIQRIETIYDNGIRFWVNPAEVGNYNVNNAPV
ncbi:MAG: hypothetical protein J6F30_06270 [Cellulosilyticum sp.]|nr:hypothetical protein [Cellulosilyticum sp.]